MIDIIAEYIVWSEFFLILLFLVIDYLFYNFYNKELRYAIA